MIDHLFERAYLLVEQHRYEDAKKILGELISLDPENASVYGLYASVSKELKDYKKAHNLIDDAININPDNDYFYFLKSTILLELNQYDEAEKFLGIAINLNPEIADYYAVWSLVKLERKQYQKALDLANQALSIDATNILGLNGRSKALIKLNRKEESYETIENALHEDPNNALTHATFGWNLLEKGNHKKALYHFEQSLKEDSNFGYAQSGMMQALKTKYLIFRWFLKYSFWIGNMGKKHQWTFIIGFYIGTRLLEQLANSYPVIAPFITPIIIVFALIAFSTWIINPLSNLFLGFNKFGKYLLDKNEKMSADFVAGSFIVFIIALIFYFIQQQTNYLAIAFFGLTMMIPFSVMFHPTKQKHSLKFYALGLAIVGVLAIYTIFRTNEIMNDFSVTYLVGLFIFQFAVNFLMIQEDNV